MQWEWAGEPSTAPAEDAAAIAAGPRRRLGTVGRWLLAASFMAAVGLWGLWAWLPEGGLPEGRLPTSMPVPVAQVHHEVDAQWNPDFAPSASGLAVGRFRLEQGLAQIVFECGAIAMLKAPVDLELVSLSEAFLYSGQLLVRVPPDSAAEGFRVGTPAGDLLDLGTEFGVEVESTGGALVQVYEGEVLATGKSTAHEPPTQRVLEGQALRLHETLEPTAFWPERFVRVLPGPDDPRGRGVNPYNKSRYDTVRISAAPPNVTIDGDLSDWDLSEQFFAACEPPYGEHYFVHAALMYDEQYLYVGAEVGDPHPMRSQVLPDRDADRHGSGGCVALRISTDRHSGWPLRAENARLRSDRQTRPDDVTHKLSFVVLWYSEPERRACLAMRHGMDLEGLQVNPEGYRGAFRKHPDGQGYTLEYAIPWAALHAAEDPPQAGDELAAMWLVHWSDAEGRNWQGQLIDVMTPDEPGWNFERAATWGKAIYLPRKNL